MLYIYLGHDQMYLYELCLILYVGVCMCTYTYMYIHTCKHTYTSMIINVSVPNVISHIMYPHKPIF